jgi:SAM-dependent methyltransferase
VTGTRTKDSVVWHDVECGAYSADLALWSELADEAGGDRCEVLELGCGTGRVALPLAALKHRVTGIDTDAELVEELARRASEHGLAIETAVADARTFSLGRSFDLALAPMQIVQLMRGSSDRMAMLARIRSHLRPGGIAGLALLGPEEEWTAEPRNAPLPDMREEGAWLYSSQPVAVRLVEDGAAIVLERVRQTVSPGGEVQVEAWRIRLELVTPEQLEQEASAVKLEPLPSREIPATDDHIGSTVVLLRRPPKADGRS